MTQSERTTFQLLSCRVELHYEDPSLENRLLYLAENAQQSIEIRKTLRYEILGTGPYEILEEGDRLGQFETSADVLHIVYGRVYRRVVERFVLAGWSAFHAALASIGGCRTMILGHKGSGKTTLATRLLFSGHQVEGDETVLERGGQALAVPRAFHLKPGVEAQIPELTGEVEGLPKTSVESTEIAALDPSRLGFEWRIEPSPIDRIVWVTPNHGGETALEARPGFMTLQNILERSIDWGEERTSLVGSAARLARGGGYELVLGDAREAARLLESVSP